MAFSFPVEDERFNELLPLLLQIIVAYADEVVTVYDKKRDGILLVRGGIRSYLPDAVPFFPEQ